jgi:potassium/hydrogen antiporter
MNIALTVVAVGLLVFLAHVFAEFFSRKKVPDVLLLIILGLVIGPVLNIVTIDQLGMVGPVFTTITLVTILFEGGTELNLDALRRSLKGTTLLTNLNFFSTMAVVGLIGWLAFDLPVMNSFMLGAIVGGTSSAVVIPLVKQLNIGNNSRTILILESAFSDVLCIVFALAIMEAIQSDQINFGLMLGQVLSSFILATVIGLAGSFFWSTVLHKIRNIKNSIFTTPAFVFILFGISEMLGYSGAISALAFGIGLANSHQLSSLLGSKKYLGTTESLNETEKILFGEVVFLLKTFFFVYIGVSIKLNDWFPLLMGLAITILLFVFRIPVVRASMPSKGQDIPGEKDLYIMSAMTPKGLAAAVLATIPFQMGLEGGEFIMNLTFSIVLFSITFTSLLIPAIDRFEGVQRFYSNSLHLNLWLRRVVKRIKKQDTRLESEKLQDDENKSVD